MNLSDVNPNLLYLAYLLDQYAIFVGACIGWLVGCLGVRILNGKKPRA